MSLRNEVASGVQYAATMGYGQTIPSPGDACKFCGDLQDVVENGCEYDSPRCRDRMECYTRRSLRAASDAAFGPASHANVTAPEPVRVDGELAVTWAEAVGGLQAEAFPELAPKDPSTGRVRPVQTALF